MGESNAAVEALCRRLPKTELHLHLDGSIAMKYILDRVHKKEVTLVEGGDTAADVVRHLLALKEQAKSGARPGAAKNWGVFDWMNCMLQNSDALETVTCLLVEELHEHNVRYAEIRFCPSLHTEAGLSTRDAIDAVAAGFARGSASTGISGGILLCALRSYDAAHSMEMAKLAEAYHPGPVLGFDVAGDERYPLELHREAISYCVARGINVTVHAGERLAGQDGTLAPILSNLRLALELGVSRIGHGFAVSLDDEVFALYAASVRSGSGLSCIEVCLGAVTPWLVPSGKFEDHPILRYIENGIACSISCDNLRLAGADLDLGTTPTKELINLKVGCGASWSQVRETLLQGIRSSFLHSEKERLALLASFTAELDSLLPSTASTNT